MKDQKYGPKNMKKKTMDSVSGTPIWKDRKRSMSQVYPNVSLQYVGLRRPITSSFRKCITVEFLIVMSKCPVFSSGKIDSTFGRNRCSKPQKHQGLQWLPVSAKGWRFSGRFGFSSRKFFCGWERETWAPTGNSWRAPETSARLDSQLGYQSCYPASQTKFDSGLKVPHFKMAEVQLTVCHVGRTSAFVVFLRMGTRDKLPIYMACPRDIRS